MKLASLILIIIIFMKINYCNKKSINYLFLTGGFDSTFRLCQLVLIEKKYVRPIYLNIINMDGEISRENQSNEIKTIFSICNKINNLSNKQYILKPIIITKHKLSNDVILASYNLYKQKKLNKQISQYTYMCDISIKLGKKIETGILLDKYGPIYKSIGNVIITKGSKNMIDVNIANNNQLMFRNLLFPLANMDKYYLKKIAIKNNFINILNNTISCWFPDKYGNSCNICNMCKERIL